MDSFSPTAEIDLDALRRNLDAARSAAPTARVMAVIKANAYGHGMVPVARALLRAASPADALAVARVEEGAALRSAGIEARIVVLGGPRDTGEFEIAAVAGLDVVLHHEQQVERLFASRLSAPVTCWLKVDTGMHRLGMPPERVVRTVERLRAASDHVSAVAGLMTHLANADDTDDSYTEEQLARLAPLRESLLLPMSIANSAGILAWPPTHADWNRPGLMLYGASPFVDQRPRAELRPVMTLRSRLVAIQELHDGDPIGYGGVWRCPQEMRVGVVAIGYGDGYPREVPNGTPVLLNDREVPLIGRVSMDMLTIDLRSQPDARVGDPVVLWGRGLPVERIAAAAGTIPYTLFCRVTERVGRVFIDDGRLAGAAA